MSQPLPPALAPLATYRQWITYRLEADPTSHSGWAKRPTDWRTGNICNAHDSSVWTDYATASEHGLVGFVFTKQDPFFFLDIDDCYKDGTWSPLALELCATLTGAAVETSVSGTGLHIIGVGAIPRHRESPKGLNVSLYTDTRFMALGSGAVGNAMTDHTPALAALVVKYFSRDAGPDTPADEWTDRPVPEWNGPTDDTELIRRALQSKSAASAFGHRASFQQLWDADHTALCLAYPQEGGYDASSADAALAQHLAFWTGKDCERMADLMQQSKLVRPKWTEHASYIRRTVVQAVAQQRDVLTDKRAEPPAPVVQAVAEPVKGETYLSVDQMQEVFKGCVYITDINSYMTPFGVLNTEKFDRNYGGRTYPLDAHGGKTAKSPSQAFWDSRDVVFPKVDTLIFAPARQVGEIWLEHGKRALNSYEPVVPPANAPKGSIVPFQNHLAKLLPDANDRAILLAYMAAMVQYPGKKFAWAPLIQGAEGNGKTTLSRCMREAIGRKYWYQPRAAQLGNQFNSWLEAKLFIQIEDLIVKEHQASVLETLESYIISEFIEVETKGQAQKIIPNYANFILNCNPKDAVRKTRNGRKIAVFYTAQQSKKDIEADGMGGEYFPALYRWLEGGGYAIVTQYLRTYAIPDALNPATTCIRAPETSSTDEAIDASAGVMEQEIINAIDQEQVGFRKGWVSSHFLDELLAKQHPSVQARWPRNRRKELMAYLDYNQCPELVPKGQVHNSVSPDGCKPVLYVCSGHRSAGMRPADIARAYSEDQTPGAGGMPGVTGGLRVVGG